MKTNKHENWPTPAPLTRPNPMRAVIERQTEEFLKNGGKIKQIPPGKMSDEAQFNKGGL